MTSQKTDNSIILLSFILFKMRAIKPDTHYNLVNILANKIARREWERLKSEHS